KKFDLPVTLDDRLIEATNHFEGMTLTRRSVRDPYVLSRLRNPFRPSWGEAYTEAVDRMVDVIKAVRRAAWGREAVCVSDQLHIWMARRAAERKRLWHRPDRRECTLDGVTSLTSADQRLAGASFSGPGAAAH